MHGWGGGRGGGKVNESPGGKEIRSDAAWVGEHSHPLLTPGAIFRAGEVPGPAKPHKTHIAGPCKNVLIANGIFMFRLLSRWRT